MDTTSLIGAVALALAMISVGVVVYYLFFPRPEANMRDLMGRQGTPGMTGTAGAMRQRLQDDESGEEYDRLKAAARKQVKRKDQITLDEKFFRAGIFSEKDKREFKRMRLILPMVSGPLFIAFGYYFLGSSNLLLVMLAGGFGVLLGLQLPFSILDRRMAARDEEIMYYLPLVIEQIAIGVSSSLDIGPCLQRVVQMADERDSHNVVTELLRHAQYYVRSGNSLEDALNEVGRRTGHNELKHAFLSLSQVAKHGGEITRQLQELADAVSQQRETRIEAVIKKLELKATLPVTLVFMGFILILLIGFFLQIMDAF